MKSAFAHRFEKGLKRVLFGVLRLFVFVRRHDSIAGETVRSILVIRQHNQLGDMLCATPLLKALRATYPQAHIALLARPLNSEVLQGASFLDEVIVYDKKRFIVSPIAVWKFARQLHSRHFDLTIVPSTVAMSVTSDVLAFLSHSHRRIGAASLQGRSNFTGYLYHMRIPLFWDTHSLVHQTQRNLAIASPLGLEEVSPELDIGLSAEERAEGKRLLNEKVNGHKFVIGFHPGAAKIPNRWDALLFAELANRCAEILGAFLVITAGPDDDEPLREMTMNMPNDHLLLHNEPIRLVASVIANCDVYVSNDTGLMHVAASAGTPTLSLFGPTDPLQWAPPGNGHRFILGKDNNVNNIPVEKVWRVLQAMLRAHAESRQWAE